MMRKLDYEEISDAELEQVLERSVAKYEAGPDTRRAGKRAALRARFIPTRRFFRTPADADGARGGDGLLMALVLATVITGVLQAIFQFSLMVAASIWLATLGGLVFSRYRLRAGGAQRAGVRQNGA